MPQVKNFFHYTEGTLEVHFLTDAFNHPTCSIWPRNPSDEFVPRRGAGSRGGFISRGKEGEDITDPSVRARLLKASMKKARAALTTTKVRLERQLSEALEELEDLDIIEASPRIGLNSVQNLPHSK